MTRDRKPIKCFCSLVGENEGSLNSGRGGGHERKGGPEIFLQQRRQDSVNQLKGRVCGGRDGISSLG